MKLLAMLWLAAVVWMLWPKRRAAEVGGPARASFGAAQRRRSDASLGALSGKPGLPPHDEGFA